VARLPERSHFSAGQLTIFTEMAGEFEKLAYETALRGLDKQEGLLEELRTRTGVLLAASSLAASFLGQKAFQNPSPRGLAITALGAFIVSIAASVFILLPKKDLYFAEAGTGLYEGLYAFRDDMPEVYRRLAYDLDHFWDSNDRKIAWLTRSFTVAAGALVIEILSLSVLLGDSIF
jgi:hypothetical protein